MFIPAKLKSAPFSNRLYLIHFRPLRIARLAEAMNRDTPRVSFCVPVLCQNSAECSSVSSTKEFSGPIRLVSRIETSCRRGDRCCWGSPGRRRSSRARRRQDPPWDRVMTVCEKGRGVCSLRDDRFGSGWCSPMRS